VSKYVLALDQGTTSSRSIREVAPNSRHGVPTGEAKGAKEARNGAKAEPERVAAAGARETPASPEVETARESGDRLPPAAEASAARAAQTAKHKQLPPMRGKEDALDFLGLGASGRTAGGINLNLTPGVAMAAVGRDQLGRERIADGERRRSKHRGAWRTMGMERWRPAIENYNSSVKPGNQTALNTARVPFATYLNQIHNRLHPIFADSFLASLESLPADSPLNKPDMRTNLEIVLDKGQREDWFQSNFIIGFAMASAIAFVLFVPWELTRRAPIVDLTLMAKRQFAVSFIMMMMVGAKGATFPLPTPVIVFSMAPNCRSSS